MIIKKLTRKNLIENIRELIEIDHVIKADDQWDEEQFLLELDGKWSNSFIALINKRIVGFIICSKKNKNTLHIHRLAVRNEYTRKGVGTQLIEKVINNADINLEYITLKVRDDNKNGQQFYEKCKFYKFFHEDDKYIYRRTV